MHQLKTFIKEMGEDIKATTTLFIDEIDFAICSKLIAYGAQAASDVHLHTRQTFDWTLAQYRNWHQVIMMTGTCSS